MAQKYKIDMIFSPFISKDELLAKGLPSRTGKHPSTCWPHLHASGRRRSFMLHWASRAWLSCFSQKTHWRWAVHGFSLSVPSSLCLIAYVKRCGQRMDESCAKISWIAWPGWGAVRVVGDLEAHCLIHKLPGFSPAFNQIFMQQTLTGHQLCVGLGGRNFLQGGWKFFR